MGNILSSTNVRFYMLVLVYIIFATLVNSIPVYYADPVKVNARLGVVSEDDHELTKNTKSVSNYKSKVVYSPIGSLNKDLGSILDNYWSKNKQKPYSPEYTSEVPTKLMSINRYQNSLKGILEKQHSEATKQEPVGMANSQYFTNSNDILSADASLELNDNTKKFVDKSAILTKANFSYYHPVHKKYYNIGQSEPTLQEDFTINTSNRPFKNETWNSNDNIPLVSDHLDWMQHQDDKNLINKNQQSLKLTPYKTTKVPYRPTAGTKSPIPFISSFPTKSTSNKLDTEAAFGPHKPLFGHQPSIFESLRKNSSNRKPHKASHTRPQNQYKTRPTVKYKPYKPTKPPFQSTMSSANQISSNPFEHSASSLNQETSNQPPYRPISIHSFPSQTFYKPIHFPTTTRPFNTINLISQVNPIAIATSDVGYKPTSTEPSVGIESNQPSSTDAILVKPIYKPTFSPVVQAEQLVVDIPSTIEQVVPEELLIITTVTETATIDPNVLPLNTLEDVDKILEMVYNEVIGLYANVISPLMLEMGNLLFGKSSDSPIRMIVIFGLPIMTALLSALGAGTFAIAVSAWLFPVFSIMFFPQIQ